MGDREDREAPAHQVDDIDEVHELDPVHQIDHKDEHPFFVTIFPHRKFDPGPDQSLASILTKNWQNLCQGN